MNTRADRQASGAGMVGPPEWIRQLGGTPAMESGPNRFSTLEFGRYRFRERPERFSAPPLSHHYISITLNGTTTVDRYLEEERVAAEFVPGQCLIMPAGRHNSWRWDRPTEEIHFYLNPTFLEEMAESADISSVELLDSFAFTDPMLQRLGATLLNEAAQPEVADKLWVETASHLVALHILRKHCRTTIGGASPDGLTGAQFRRVHDFVEENMGREIGLAEMSGIAGTSLFHFAHMFKRSRGISPHRWLIEKRIERAKFLLRSTDLPILEVANRVGYLSQSHFGHVFRRATGLSPRAWRKNALQ